MRSILLHVHNDDCLEARLQAGLELARAFDGHLTCLQAMPFELGLPGDLYGLMAGQMAPVIDRVASETRDRLEARLATEDVAWSWVDTDGLAAEQLLLHSGLSDVIVLGSRDPLRDGPALVAGDVVLRAGTPVMIVPADARRLDCAGGAVVAWDGSLEASRALRGARPLLARASAVELVWVRSDRGPSDKALPATEGAAYLSRHGIGCQLTEIAPVEGSVAQALLAAAATRRAAYLVMGAYGHARLRETIWGGVTHEVLGNPQLPIVACH